MSKKGRMNYIQRFFFILTVNTDLTFVLCFQRESVCGPLFNDEFDQIMSSDQCGICASTCKFGGI